MIRKHAIRSIDDLESLWRSAKSDTATLVDLRHELTYRSTRRARSLLALVESRIAVLGHPEVRITPIAASQPKGSTVPLPPRTNPRGDITGQTKSSPVMQSARPTTPTVREIANSLRSNASRTTVRMSRCTVCGSPAIPGDSLCFTHCR